MTFLLPLPAVCRRLVLPIGFCAGLLAGLLPGGVAHAQDHQGADCPAAVAQWVPPQRDRAPALLAVLSPRMVYALKEWPRMAAVARAQGFRLHVLRDARVPLQEWHEAVRAADLPDLRDIEALDEAAAAACQLANHWPAVLVMGCGQVHPWPVLGVMPDEAWRHVLQHRAVWLKEHACP